MARGTPVTGRHDMAESWRSAPAEQPIRPTAPVLMAHRRPAAQGEDHVSHLDLSTSRRRNACAAPVPYPMSVAALEREDAAAWPTMVEQHRESRCLRCWGRRFGIRCQPEPVPRRPEQS